MEIINSDPFCEVRLEPVIHNGETTDKFMVSLQEQDRPTFKPLSGVRAVHGDSYRLVTNRQVHDMAQDVISSTGMQFLPVHAYHNSRTGSIGWNGRRFSEKWYSPDVSVANGDRSNMMMGIGITNSYDGSCKIGLSFFAMRCVCENQFFSRNLMGSPFELPHVNRGGNLFDDMDIALNQIKAKAETFAQLGPHIQKLQEHGVGTLKDFLDLREALVTDTKVEFHDKALLDELSGNGITRELNFKNVVYEDPYRYWDVANAYTAVGTHVVGGARGADQTERVVDWLIHRAA